MKRIYETLFATVGVVIILCMLNPAASAQTATITIDDLIAEPEENVTVPIIVSNVTDLGGCDINITYNVSVVHVVNVIEGDMTLLRYLIDNETGWMHANTISVTGLAEDVVVAYISLTAVGCEGDTSPLDISVDKLFDMSYDSINYTVTNGTLAIEKLIDAEPPIVTKASASRDTILNDNGRSRRSGTNITVLNVTVNDEESGVSDVSIDLSPIGGSPVQPMEQITGTDIWRVTTNAVSGINQTHHLTIDATDHAGNCNDSVSVELTVLRRGDVCRDDTIDMDDVMRISGCIIGIDPNPPNPLVGDVVGALGDPVGDGIVDLMDALYIARYGAGLEDEP
ncbi:MAG TPA: hypothetical protein EYP67_05620 [Methanosarcinales archaeon]|nr:hypothetical protein [Methanosarcinales archaeon]